jgi:hypothetical protein
VGAERYQGRRHPTLPTTDVNAGEIAVRPTLTAKPCNKMRADGTWGNCRSERRFSAADDVDRLIFAGGAGHRHGLRGAAKLVGHGRRRWWFRRPGKKTGRASVRPIPGNIKRARIGGTARDYLPDIDVGLAVR